MGDKVNIAAKTFIESIEKFAKLIHDVDRKEKAVEILKKVALDVRLSLEQRSVIVILFDLIICSSESEKRWTDGDLVQFAEQYAAKSNHPDKTYALKDFITDKGKKPKI